MSSNEDIESPGQQQSYKMTLHATASPNSSPPRPGFPQRILTHHQYSTRSKSPIDCVKKSYSYDSAMSSYSSVTQKLLPTTFISNKPYSSNTSQEKTLTIDEESESTNIDDDEMKPDEISKQPEAPYVSSTSELPHAFQVTSPTEETMPTSTFDYLYEFSETRKVLEEFFKVPDSDKIKELEKFSDFNESDDSLVSFSFIHFPNYKCISCIQKSALMLFVLIVKKYISSLHSKRIFNMITVGKLKRKWKTANSIQ
jgi:hypothetical protein